MTFLRAQWDDVLAIQQDFPTVHRGQPGDATQQCGLAATGWAEEGDELALGYLAVVISYFFFVLVLTWAANILNKDKSQ